MSADEDRGAEASPDEMKKKKRVTDIKEAFLLFDKNGDGSISATELGQFLRSLGKDPSDDELTTMIKNIDIDGNGQIDFEEFVEMMSRQEEDDIQESFRVFDKNGDGFISIHELKQVITALGEVVSDEELKVMLDEADADGDGQIDYEEFTRMLTTPR